MRDSVKNNDCQIFVGDKQLNKLPQLIKSIHTNKVFILTDSNAKKYVISQVKKLLFSFDVITIKCGEQHKTIFTCQQVWEQLSKKGANRHSLLINLGGGTICDLGGFVASTYMRGIKYINIPTTLLAMVDASVGGKTGVDFNGLKNQVGLFSSPQYVFVCPVFLKSLNKRLLLCGYAEMLKHSLISDAGHWEQLKNLRLNNVNWVPIINRSIQIKKQIVESDPHEKGIRKLLNFGHTAAHALEAYLVRKKKNKIMHGEAVAWGMLVESYLSAIYAGLSSTALLDITTEIKKRYSLKLASIKISDLIKLMHSDKKNNNNKINFSLLMAIGRGGVDYNCSEQEIEQAVLYANEQFK